MTSWAGPSHFGCDLVVILIIVLFFSDRDDGYADLENTLRMIHPINLEDNLRFQISKQDNATTFPVRVNNVITFSEGE